MKRKKWKYPKTPINDEKRSFDIFSKYPFLIHATETKPLYPTHTHGLHEIGMPEIIFDPLAFGVKGNAKRINAAYKYLIRPENDGVLEVIKNGASLTLTTRALLPDLEGEPPYTYCLRRVGPDFEGVKLAYHQQEILSDMWFVQMYTDGDNFALTDDYYRGGIRW